MRQRGQNYKTLDGLHEDRDAVAWYWRMLAVASSFMLLGGYVPAISDRMIGVNADQVLQLLNATFDL